MPIDRLLIGDVDRSALNMSIRRDGLIALR